MEADGLGISTPLIKVYQLYKLRKLYKLFVFRKDSSVRHMYL